MYEGEYLNGEKNGKGKEYDKKGELKYKGKFLNDKRHGKGKEYDKNDELKYEGEYLYGKRKKSSIFDCIISYVGIFI